MGGWSDRITPRSPLGDDQRFPGEHSANADSTHDRSVAGSIPLPGPPSQQTGRLALWRYLLTVMDMPRGVETEGVSPVRRHVVLEPQPQSAGRARKVVGELLEACDLDELADTATLLVSELVTNSVLHAATSVHLRCHVEAGTLCVRVSDLSPVLPGMRHYQDDALTGRGLGMVELLAADWGIDADATGKTVWFRLAHTDAQLEYLKPGPAATSGDCDGGRFLVSFLGLPPALLLMTVQYGDSLLRELALTSMAAAADDNIQSWQTVNVDLGPLLNAAEEAQGHGSEAVDVTVSFPAGAGAAAFERLSLIDEAVRMARDGLLLSVPTLPEIESCRRWFLSQIGLQE